jgi:hypothetical protein
MNPNDARLVRIYTRKQNGVVADETPIGGTNGGTASFEVVVEGEAGDVLGASGAPYQLRISAIDLTDVNNPESAQNDFTQDANAAFQAPDWPQFRKVFTVALNDVPAVRNHTLRYMATLNAANEVDSAIESELFSLTQ